MSQPETNQLDDVFSFEAKRHIETLRDAKHPDQTHRGTEYVRTGHLIGD